MGECDGVAGQPLTAPAIARAAGASLANIAPSTASAASHGPDGAAPSARAGAATVGQGAITCIAVHLQYACEAGQRSDRALGLAVGCIDAGHGLWIGAAPRAVVACGGSQLPCLGAAPGPGSSIGAVVSSAKSFVDARG